MILKPTPEKPKQA